MLACLDWVLIIFGTQVIKKNRSVRSLFPDYLSVFYDYVLTGKFKLKNVNTIKIFSLAELLTFFPWEELKKKKMMEVA